MRVRAELSDGFEERSMVSAATGDGSGLPVPRASAHPDPSRCGLWLQAA